MNGTVTRLRPMGIEATMESATDALTGMDLFRVYRMDGDAEVLVGIGFAKRSKGANLINLNAVEGSSLGDAKLGDLVRSI